MKSKIISAIIFSAMLMTTFSACSGGQTEPEARQEETTIEESVSDETEADAEDNASETIEADSLEEFNFTVKKYIEDVIQTTEKITEQNSEETSATETEDIDLEYQKNNFDENNSYNVQSGNYIIPVPDYWERGISSEDELYYIGYLETSGEFAFAFLMIDSIDTSNPVTFETLYDSKDSVIKLIEKGIVENLGNNLENCEFIDSDIYESEEIKGINFSYNFTLLKDTEMADDIFKIKGNKVKGKWMDFIFPSEEDSKLIIIQLMVLDNTGEYHYDDDFEKILASIKKKDDTNSSSVISNGIRPEFKEAMDSYEAFFDEYCNIMKKYNEDPTDFSLLTEYLEYMDKYSEAMDKLDEIGEEEMSDEEALYYTETMLRINQKILSVY